MSPADLASAFGHEQVVFCHDEATGLRAIIAIYSTALGPALGGTRFYPYAGEAVALHDALRLSRAMAYKNAAAGLDHGGGKAVIIGDPSTQKTPELLRAYGRFVQSLGGRYVTACDVGTTVADLDVVGTQTRFATGRSTAVGGAGDSSVLTAYGVFEGMRAAAAHVWGSPSLAGRTVGVAGVGKVGRQLVGHLLQDGALVRVADVSPAAVDHIVQQHPEVQALPDTDALVRSDLDVYAPCAMGGTVDAAAVQRLTARIVCGAANNQLADERIQGGTADQLLARGITYAPDFLVNAGGVVQVSDELRGFDFARAKAATARIYDVTARVLGEAAQDGVSPLACATRLAQDRMIAAGHPGRLWLP